MSPAANGDPMAEPVVSVCIPVYNTARFVGQAIESVLSQTYSAFELLIVDNASSDATPQIIARYSDPRIRVVRNDHNIGAAPNFNKALSLARGRYVKILCADDLLYPTILEKQVLLLEADVRGELAMVGCARHVIDSRGKRWMLRRFAVREGRIPGGLAIELTVRAGSNTIGEPMAMLGRADAMRAAGGFDPAQSFCLDLDLWGRLLARGDLYMIDEALCGFRISDQSWSVGIRNRHREFVRFINDVERRGVPLSAFDRLSGRVRAYLKAMLRPAITRVLLFAGRQS